MSKVLPVILQSGFRLFFIGAAVQAVVSVVFWMLFYIFSWPIFVEMPVSIWHGHEMVYGFTIAVITGFLLTAVSNWTGQKTLDGLPLLMLFVLWFVSRVLAFVPGQLAIYLLFISDNLFLIFLLITVVRPVIQVKQWRQFAVFSKIIILFICNILFFMSLQHQSIHAIHLELTFCVYMIVSLILTVSRRVIPFFVQKGVGCTVVLRNSKFLDIFSMILLVVFSLGDIFYNQWFILPWITGLLVVLHSVRLSGWFTKGVLRIPLLWVLFLGYGFIIIGFILKTLSYWFPMLVDSALHAFTYGGIGVMCLGMMARVAWGHTGRSIQDPPKVISIMFLILMVGACIRVFAPILMIDQYMISILVAQILWMIAFSIFLIVYSPILISPRVDGKFG